MADKWAAPVSIPVLTHEERVQFRETSLPGYSWTIPKMEVTCSFPPFYEIQCNRYTVSFKNLEPRVTFGSHDTGHGDGAINSGSESARFLPRELWRRPSSGLFQISAGGHTLENALFRLVNQLLSWNTYHRSVEWLWNTGWNFRYLTI